MMLHCPKANPRDSDKTESDLRREFVAELSEYHQFLDENDSSPQSHFLLGYGQ